MSYTLQQGREIISGGTDEPSIRTIQYYVASMEKSGNAILTERRHGRLYKIVNDDQLKTLAQMWKNDPCNTSITSPASPRNAGEGTKVPEMDTRQEPESLETITMTKEQFEQALEQYAFLKSQQDRNESEKPPPITNKKPRVYAELTIPSPRKLLAQASRATVKVVLMLFRVAGWGTYQILIFIYAPEKFQKTLYEFNNWLFNISNQKAKSTIEAKPYRMQTSNQRLLVRANKLLKSGSLRNSKNEN